MDLSEEKAALRAQAFAQRKAAHEAALGGRAAYLSEFLAGYRGVPLAGYIPIRTEISPLSAMAEAAAHGSVCVPVIQGAGLPLTFSKWEPGCKMKPGSFGVAVPDQYTPLIPEIVIVPLVAFDPRGGRLGYGGGFYDRTLAQLRQNGAILAIGFAYSGQKFAHLPICSTDQPLDMVVTEHGILDF